MTEIKPPLKILILEDNPFDVRLMKELILYEIRDSEFYCARDREGYLKALDTFAPDIILSDNCFPQFTAVEALDILRKRSEEIPFILVTGSLSEEMAVGIIEQGANDYILKDRMARLPIAIEAVLKQRSAAKEIVDYRYALDKAAIVAITDRQGIITYANENGCKISGYEKAELIGSKLHKLHTGLYGQEPFNRSWLAIQKGTIWQGEFLNLAKNGDRYWVHTVIIPFPVKKSQPGKYLAISNNITEKKKLEAALKQQQQNEQSKISAIEMAVQEKERNMIGQELHDNVNQLLVATKLLLSLMIQRTGGDDELLQQCNENIFIAIEENRKIARVFASPDLETETLPEQLKKLTESMLTVTGLKAHIDTSLLNESLLSKEQKLALYRVLQEQCTNIVKHAGAKNVFITLQTSDGIFNMTIADDGHGIDSKEKIAGVGLKNIIGRVGIFNGIVSTISSPGCGFTLKIEIPVNSHLSQAVRN